MSETVALCTIDDLAPGEARRFDVAGHRIALVRIGDEFHAVDDECSHEDYSLAEGEVWVDDHDLQIVKTYGKSVPDIRKKNQENLFPKFTTWRQQIDNVYWFPVYTRADDVLHFSMGDVHIREIVKYEDYKRFGSKVKITYQGQELPGQSQPGSQQGQQQPPNQPQGQPAPPSQQGQPAPPAQQPPTKPQ